MKLTKVIILLFFVSFLLMETQSLLNDKSESNLSLERIKSKSSSSSSKMKGILNKYNYSNMIKDFNDGKCLEHLLKDKFSQKDISAYKLFDKSVLGSEKTYKQNRLRIGLMLLCIFQTNKDIDVLDMEKNTNINTNNKNIIENVNDVYKYKLLGAKTRLNRKCTATVEGIKYICMVGSVCSNEKCMIGFKQKKHSCQYNYECDKGLKCDENFKCVDAPKDYAEDLYKVTKENFLKIKFVNLIDDNLGKNDIDKYIDLNSDLINTKIESLGKMLLSISVALGNNSPENIYSSKVIDASKDVYKFNFSGNGLSFKDENCVESTNDKDGKSICMPGTFCSAKVKNICELGFKKKDHTCTYSSECDNDLICISNKCLNGKKQKADKIPLVEKMEKRLSENINGKSEVATTLVRHKSELGSMYNLKSKTIEQNRNSETQNKVRDELLQFILDREKLSVTVETTNKQNGVFFIDKDEGFISLKKDAPYEDTSNHELMHYVDYLIGLKKIGKKFTSGLKFENFLSFQLLDSKPDYIEYQDLILTNLIESFNLKNYRSLYKDDKKIICEIPTNLMQQKNLKLENLYDISKEYLTDYANELKSMSFNQLTEVANYILNRIK